MAAEEGRARERQFVLGTVLIGLSLLSLFVLFEVVATIVFAMTVAYILSPAKRRLRRRGMGQLLATFIVTVGAVIGLLAIVAPVAVMLFLRLDEATALLLQLPSSLTIEPLGHTYELELIELLSVLQGWLQGTAVAFAIRIPELLVKFALFGFLVFALIHNERDIASSIFSVVPPRHRDIARSLHRRSRDTLYAIYVLQGATAFATLLIAAPIFYLFGYDAWFVLATSAGILQFVPVIGPSVLIAAIVVAEVVLGAYLQAALVLIFGGIAIAAFPDLVVRPRIARHTIQLSSTLYFIGFVGGLLTIGALGIIIGPLLVVLVVEASQLLSKGFESTEVPAQNMSD